MITEKHAGGRPTLFNDEILVRSKDYLNVCRDVMNGDKIKVNLPTIEGLALCLEVTRSTVYLWQKEHPEFSDILDTLLQKQAQALINNGLSGSYNSPIAKLLLAKHGYTDKQEIDYKAELNATIKKTVDYNDLSDETLIELENHFIRRQEKQP